MREESTDEWVNAKRVRVKGCFLYIVFNWIRKFVGRKSIMIDEAVPYFDIRR